MDSLKSEQVRHAVRELAGFGLPFLLVAYLAFAAGGYDIVPRSQVGILAWWVVLLGVLAGILPLFRPGRFAILLVSVLGGMFIWTAFGLFWTDSAEHTITELSRVGTLLGILTLLVLTQNRESLRHAVAGVAAAVILVAVVALVDRLLPDLLPFGSDYVFPEGYPRARINYPLEYWNALATLIAMGSGPVIWLMTMADRRAVRSLAAGALPVLALTGYMTASRGGVVEILAVLVVLVVLFPERLRLMLNLLAPVAGSVILVALLNQRDAIRDLDPGQLALDQGSQMAWLTLGVVAAVIAIHWASLAIAGQYGIKLKRPDRRVTRTLGFGVAGVAVAAALVLVASGYAGDRWEEFKQPSSSGTVDRLGNINSGERYLLWKSASEAAESERLTGIGPGAFEFWWARDDQGSQFARDAHSIYLENLAELGPLGMLLVLALVLGPIGLAATFALRGGEDRFRALAAAAAAGMVAFAVAAGIDWAWEMTVLSVMFMIFAATVCSARGRPEDWVRVDGTAWSFRLPMAAIALLAMAVVFVPMSATRDFRESQSLVRAGDLEGALDKAEAASDLQPYATTFLIQRAQVLQLIERDQEAARLARDATEEEPVNWTNWLVLSQILETSSPGQSRAAYEQARKLNPKSAIFGTR